MRPPHRVVVDWVMEPYDGPFPLTTRKMETIKACALCYLAIPVLVIVLLGWWAS